MHNGGNEKQYKIFAQEAKKRGIKIKVAPATKQGDSFY